MKKTRCSVISFQNNYTVLSVKERVKVEVPDLIEVAQYLSREGVAKESLIILLQDGFDASKHICDFYCSTSFAKHTDFHALVINSNVKRWFIALRVFLKSPKFKFRTFKTVSEAVSWLNKEQNKSIDIQQVSVSTPAFT